MSSDDDDLYLTTDEHIIDVPVEYDNGAREYHYHPDTGDAYYYRLPWAYYYRLSWYHKHDGPADHNHDGLGSAVYPD